MLPMNAGLASSPTSAVAMVSMAPAENPTMPMRSGSIFHSAARRRMRANVARESAICGASRAIISCGSGRGGRAAVPENISAIERSKPAMSAGVWFSRYLRTNAATPRSASARATFQPSFSIDSVRKPPPGATTTAAPLAFAGSGRNGVIVATVTLPVRTWPGAPIHQPPSLPPDLRGGDLHRGHELRLALLERRGRRRAGTRLDLPVELGQRLPRGRAHPGQAVHDLLAHRERRVLVAERGNQRGHPRPAARQEPLGGEGLLARAAVCELLRELGDLVRRLRGRRRRLGGSEQRRAQAADVRPRLEGLAGVEAGLVVLTAPQVAPGGADQRFPVELGVRL